jgi:hypothetical protein
VLRRVVHELGVGQGAVVTLHDIHGWSLRECPLALRRCEDEARALLRAGREGVRAALEAEVDCSEGLPAQRRARRTRSKCRLGANTAPNLHLGAAQPRVGVLITDAHRARPR